ncbi:MAG: colanic acid biosynthesis glycosyltransferase WcaL, partial [Acidobacteriota bacterium]
MSRKTDTRRRVAYTMSRFPKLTETFVLYELVTLERLGFNISLYPLIREQESVRHAEVEKWLNRARFLPFFSLRIL